jgi:outer membrane protein OmpA-like peptidoglycan-associated protein
MYVNATGYRADQLTSMVTNGTSSEPIVEPAGLGDISVDAKYRFRNIPLHGTGVFASVRATLPTSNSFLPLGGDGPIVDIELGADKQIENVHLAANIGHRQQSDAALASQAFGSSVYGRLGAGYQDGLEATGYSVEYVTGSVYGQSGSVGQEAVVSVFKPMEEHVIRGGFGWGIGSGISTPKFRFLLSLQPHKPLHQDTDGDGIIDIEDQCPMEHEDLDGYKDSDGCIDLTTVSLKFVDGKGNEVSGVQWNVGDQSGSNGDTFTWQVMEGNHANVIASAEGFKEHTYNVEVMNVDNTEATVTMVADVGTLLVKAVDEEGNPINAGWIVKGKKPFVKLAGEAHKMAIGDFNIQVRAKGFKPVTKKATIQAGSETVIEVTMKKSLANVDGNKISIDDSVYFATGSHVILEKSHKLLDDVAHILDEHPSITKLEIEGHTDSQGKDSANKALSQMRADAVKEYLISKGIGESRLHSIGYGEEKPIASNDTEEGRAQNRRVHFHIAEQDHSKEEH